MTKTVYFVRHGESQANVDGVIAGAGHDSPLTEVGKKQAASIAERLQGINFDFIVTSPMSRTRDTVKIICDYLELNPDRITVNADFIEKDVGEFSGRPNDEYFALEKAGGKSGESPEAMQIRVKRGIDWLKAQDFTNALVVTHNGTTRVIQTINEGRPAKDFAIMPPLANGDFLKINL